MSEPSQPKQATAGPTQSRILVVDDDESFRLQLTRTLRMLGYEVVAAEDGAIALRLFRENRFDMVITDLLMPTREGYETIMELRKAEPAMPIIAISGGGRFVAEQYLPTARVLGAARTLAKPFTIEQLQEAVAGLIRPTPAETTVA